MEHGYIKIEENDNHEFIVKAKLIDGNLWLTKHEIAHLFNVFVNTIGNNLQAIFKSGILHKDDVTHIHKFEHKGRECQTTLYNLEALIFVSYRIASYEARAFREWVMKALTEYTRIKDQKEKEVLIVYNLSSKRPSILSN